jgi:hypothetical protein
LWAVGTLLALVTIALLVGLLVVNLDAVKWEDLSRERIEQVALFIGIAVAATTLIVLLAIGGASLGWTGFGDKTVWDWLQLLSALAIPSFLPPLGCGSPLSKKEVGKWSRSSVRRMPRCKRTSIKWAPFC